MQNSIIKRTFGPMFYRLEEIDYILNNKLTIVADVAFVTRFLKFFFFIFESLILFILIFYQPIKFKTSQWLKHLNFHFVIILRISSV